MTSSIVLVTTLMWFLTQRFVKLLKAQIFFCFLAEGSSDVTFLISSNHAQNIKKLLKIPYSKSHVSMAVHRVGRTLLLDELDIQELFMNSSKVEHHLHQDYSRAVGNKDYIQMYFLVCIFVFPVVMSFLKFLHIIDWRLVVA